MALNSSMEVILAYLGYAGVLGLILLYVAKKPVVRR